MQKQKNNRLISQLSSLKNIRNGGREASREEAGAAPAPRLLADLRDGEVQAAEVCFARSQQLFISWLPPRRAKITLSPSLPRRDAAEGPQTTSLAVSAQNKA